MCVLKASITIKVVLVEGVGTWRAVQSNYRITRSTERFTLPNAAVAARSDITAASPIDGGAATLELPILSLLTLYPTSYLPKRHLSTPS